MVHEDDLPPAPLLRRGAEHLHLPGEIAESGSQSDGRPHRGGGDDIVSARVAEALEGIVLREKGHHSSLCLSPLHRPEGGLHAAEGHLHLETVAGKQLGLPLRRKDLFEGGLRMGVNGVAQLHELPAKLLGGLQNSIMHDSSSSFRKIGDGDRSASPRGSPLPGVRAAQLSPEGTPWRGGRSCPPRPRSGPRTRATPRCGRTPCGGPR